RVPPASGTIRVMDAFHFFLHLADEFAEWTRLVLETLGVATIAIGAGAVLVRIARQTHTERHVSLTETRFVLARYLVLALEFQLAADVPENAILAEANNMRQ